MIQPKQWQCSLGDFCPGVTLWIERDYTASDLLNMLAVKVLAGVRRGAFAPLKKLEQHNIGVT